MTFPPGTFSSNASEEKEVTPYTIRRHPKYADGVLQLPEDTQNAQVLYLKSIAEYKNRDYVGSRKDKDGKINKDFKWIKYSEAFEISKKFGCGLATQGVKNETRVCIFSENRPEWILTMDASYLYGFTMISLYDTFTTDALEFSIQNCEAKYIIVSRKNLKALMNCKDEVLQQFKLVITFDSFTDDDNAARSRLESLGISLMTFDGVKELGEKEDVPYAKINPEQILYVCYSSGTTGFPKGVMISHRCFITNLLAIFQERKGNTFERHLSYLPLCHVFERMCSSCALLGGGKIGIFSGNVAKLTEDMAALKPTVFIIVPRVLQRINDAINAQMKKSSVIVRGIFNTAWYIKRAFLQWGMPVNFLDAVVFNKIKNMMGGNITQIVNGGAALPAELHETMQVILGIPIRPGYGLSEGGSGNTLNPCDVKKIKLGTSGYPLANVQLRIVKVPDFEEEGVGEIQMGGTGLCTGYLNDEEATDALFTDKTHEWIHTGDIGKFDEDNSLVVVDRMRSIFKLSQGEYVAGDLLASYFEAADLISSIFVFGDSTRQYLVGIVIPERAALGKLFGNTKMTPEEYKKAVEDPKTNEAIMEQIKQIAVERKLLGFQKVIAIKCVDDEWTIENGCLSPTFKPKRKVLATRYHEQIEELYAKGRQQKK
jgi:long-chain acyl-CoA synthetase